MIYIHEYDDITMHSNANIYIFAELYNTSLHYMQIMIVKCTLQL